MYKLPNYATVFPPSYFLLSFMCIKDGHQIGAEYLVFVSSRSLKTREKYTNWDNLVCFSLYIFEYRAIYVYFYKILSFVKVNIDGSVLKKYTNWDKLSCLSLYIFLSFSGNERRQKPNIPHLKVKSHELNTWKRSCVVLFGKKFEKQKKKKFLLNLKDFSYEI